MAVKVVTHENQPREEWRSGVVTRVHVSAMSGAAALCIFEQWIAPGEEAPGHTHSVEEVLTVLAGEAELWVDDEKAVLGAGHSLIIPANARHGFRNSGSQTLHMHAVLAAPVFEANYDDRRVRRWVPPEPARRP